MILIFIAFLAQQLVTHRKTVSIQENGSEPIVCDTSAISRQMFEAVEPVEMGDGYRRHGLRFGQSQVDCDTAAPLFIKIQRSPICHAATCGAEMEPNRLAPNVDLGWARDIYALAFKVIGPQHTVAATYGAITCGGRLGHSLESVLDCTAVAGTLDHSTLFFIFSRPARPALLGTPAIAVP